ncbi:MAG: hypothetical protein JXB60_05950 [Candidatus Cloacimonetes bacterium]|nr:hypothetical protein [Candidatus Cloacimonadota bacterium]
MKRNIITIVTLLLFLSLAAEVEHQFLNPYLQTPSLIDFSRITMSHSASFAAGYSSNNRGYYQSMYTNHINYRLSEKLNFNLDLNFVNFGTTTHEGLFQVEGNDDNSSRIFPEFMLHYQPSENTSIVIEYRQITPADYWQSRW